MAGVFKKVLHNPVSGLSPWIVMSLVSGSNGRFELSVGLALALSILLVVLSATLGVTLKLLELFDTFYFVGLAIAGLLASPDTTHWLQQWAGEISNIAMVVIAFLSLVIRRPFTLSYARGTVDPALWHRPAFVHTNYLMTWIWTIAFAVGAASGAYGDVVLQNPNNLWTGWIIQTAAVVVAFQFTLWYSEQVQARARREHGSATDTPAPVSDLLVSLSAWLVPVGVIALVVGGSPWWVGTGFIVGGAVLTGVLHRDRRSRGARA